jgi:hypothetical protein
VTSSPGSGGGSRTALLQAWSSAYHEDALPTAPAEWHDRWYPHLMRLVDSTTNQGGRLSHLAEPVAERDGTGRKRH